MHDVGNHGYDDGGQDDSDMMEMQLVTWSGDNHGLLASAVEDAAAGQWGECTSGRWVCVHDAGLKLPTMSSLGSGCRV